MPQKVQKIPKGLAPDVLRRVCDPASLGFATTDELPAFDSHLGQARAIDALRLSVRMTHRDFNVYVLGREGFGRHHAVRQILDAERAGKPTPPDWVYVNNFDAPHRPRALKLPSGAAETFRRAMENMVDDLGNEIPALFDSDEYQTQRRVLEQEFGGRHEAELAEFGEKARKEDIGLVRTPMGFVLVAMQDGEVVKPEDFEELEEAKRTEIETKIAHLQEDLAVVLRNAPKLEKEHRHRLEKLHAEMAERTVSERMIDVTKRLPKDPEIAAYLGAVRSDIIDNAELFLTAASRDVDDGPFPAAMLKYHLMPEFQRYQVNVVISHGAQNGTGAPIVHEDLPSMGHLVGRIEHVSQMGAMMTDFTLIKPGALHRANGGFLVLDARRLLTEPYAWDALKRCLKNRDITITSMADRISLISTVSLEPDPIPLDVRVVLIGDRWLHMLLSNLDPEFSELFKIQADFEEDFPSNPENQENLSLLIASLARENDLRPINAPAMARLLDEATRQAGDTKKTDIGSQRVE